MATIKSLFSVHDQISADTHRRHALFEWESRFTNIRKIRKYFLSELRELISQGLVVDEAGVRERYDEIEKFCKKLIRRRVTRRLVHGVGNSELSDDDGGSHSGDQRENCVRGSHANNRKERLDSVLCSNCRRRLEQSPKPTNNETIIQVQESDQQINPDCNGNGMAGENSSNQHDNRGSEARKDNGDEGHEDQPDSNPDQEDHHGQAGLPDKNLAAHQENDLCQANEANGNNEGTTAGPSNADENPCPDHGPKGPDNNYDGDTKRILMQVHKATKVRTRSQTRTNAEPFLVPPQPPPTTLGFDLNRDKRSRYNGNVTPSPTTPDGSLKRPCLAGNNFEPEKDPDESWSPSLIQGPGAENHELPTGFDPLDRSLPVLDYYPEFEKEQPEDEPAPEADHDDNNDDDIMADGTERNVTCRSLDERIPLDTNTKDLIKELQDRIEGWKPRPGRPNPAVVDKIKKMKDHFKEAFKEKMEELFTKGEYIDFNDKKRITTIVDEITEQAFKLHQSPVSQTIKKFVRNSLIQLLVRQFIKKTW